MQLGAQAVFVGSGIFKSDDPARRARAIVEATTHFADAEHVAKVSTGLGRCDARAAGGRADRPAGRPRLVVVTRPPSDRRVTIGILALQGDVREHEAAFDELGVATRLVRRPAQLDGVDGIVLPGGESTTLSMLLRVVRALRPARRARWPTGSRPSVPAPVSSCWPGGSSTADRTSGRSGCSTARSVVTATAASGPRRLESDARGAPASMRATMAPASRRRCRPSSSGRRSSSSSVPASTCWRRWTPGRTATRTRSPAGRGRCWPPRSIRS